MAQYSSESLLILKGDLDCKKIIGTSKTYLICKDKCYHLKQTFPSSTILILKNGILTKPKLIIEAMSFKKTENILEHIKPTRPNKMDGIEAGKLQEELLLGDAELADVIKIYNLAKIGNKVFRFEYSQLCKFSVYLRSIKLTGGCIKDELSFYSDQLIEWISGLDGTKSEIIKFCILGCWEKNDFKNIYGKLKDLLMEDVMNEEIEGIMEDVIKISGVDLREKILKDN